MMENKYILFWLNSCIVLITILITVGGITRLTNSGLSMVDWKPIMGIVPPLNNEQWQVSFNEYKRTPEFYNYHNNFVLKDYQKIFFWEYLHRVLGRLVGLLFLVPLFIFKRKGCFTKNEYNNLRNIFFLICFQGLIGWIMVKSGLVGKGDVSPYRLAIHFSTAIFIIGYIYWMKLIIEFRTNNSNNNSFIKLIQNIFILFFFQIFIGSICAGFSIGKEFINHDIFVLIKNIISKEAYFIQSLHIILGTIFMLAILFLSKRLMDNDRLFKYSNSLSYIVIFQYFLGFLNLALETPFIIALLHQFFVIVVIIIMIKLRYMLIYDN